MQVQVQRQQTHSTVSPKQSIAVIKTLLSASFGCIAFLRNLLPEENFGEGFLMSARQGSMSYESSSQSITEDTPESDRNYSRMRIKTVTRGYSPEADKLLDYMENGIYHALDRHYLKSFIFAIYLDNDDPNNIVEAYTYEFTYRTFPGTDGVIPVMSLGEDLMKMSLGGKLSNDPVELAASNGLVPTLGDVKKSLRMLIKNLIMVTTPMEPLPKRRYATFKLFYTDDTPADYEPPYFRPGDPDKDKFIFTTHEKSEIPDRVNIGKLQTPHHGVDVRVESVTGYLPTSEHNEAHYAGYSSRHGANLGTMPPASMSAALSKQAEVQRKDAEKRAVVWDAEKIAALSDEDAEGEDDPDYLKHTDNNAPVPIGLRLADRTIVLLDSRGGDDDMEVDLVSQAEYCGVAEVAPSRVGKLKKQPEVGSMEPTQQLELTQLIAEPPPGSTKVVDHQMSTLPMESSYMTNGIDTQILKGILQHTNQNVPTQQMNDSVMHNMEAQIRNDTSHESIESYSTPQRVLRNGRSIVDLNVAEAKKKSAIELDQTNAECVCRLGNLPGDIVACEGPCERWYHLWCMGYHSVDDNRLPKQFICVECLLRADQHFELIRASFSEILTKFSDLALFRCAIKLAQLHQPESLKAFKAAIGCQATLAEQLWKRLEIESFILVETTETDALGLLQTRTQGKKSHKKKRKTRVTTRYIFNPAITNTRAYHSLFEPCSEVENKMIGLNELGRRGRRVARHEVPAPGSAKEPSSRERNAPVVSDGNISHSGAPTLAVAKAGARSLQELVTVDSQTQEDSQYMVPSIGDDQKRRPVSEGQAGPKKKMKISIGDGVDIEE